MAQRNVSIHAALLAGSMLAWPAVGAEVTPERLLKPNKEPQNWLMKHHFGCLLKYRKFGGA
jgi:hypothetical protein